MNTNSVNDLIDYIDETEVHICDPEDCKKILTVPNNKVINILSQNIRSLNHNMSGLQLLLNRMDVEPDVIILSECWLNTNLFLQILPNYTSYSSKNNYNQNDGVVCYIKDELQHFCYEPKFQEANCLVTILNNNTALVSIYRPYAFKQIDSFLKSLDMLLSSLGNYGTIILMGDINIDIVPSVLNQETTNNYLTLLATHGLLPAYNCPTHTNTCLDTLPLPF